MNGVSGYSGYNSGYDAYAAFSDDDMKAITQSAATSLGNAIGHDTSEAVRQSRENREREEEGTSL